MKSHTKHLVLHTKERMEFLNRVGSGQSAVGSGVTPRAVQSRREQCSHGPGRCPLLIAHCPPLVVVAVTKGKLDFGPWEQIFYGEFDGRRDKRVMIKIIGE